MSDCSVVEVGFQAVGVWEGQLSAVDTDEEDAPWISLGGTGLGWLLGPFHGRQVRLTVETIEREKDVVR